jgi:hypothetical protein
VRIRLQPDASFQSEVELIDRISCSMTRISRREFISGAAALSACTALERPAEARGGIIAGATRWDASYGSQNGRSVDAALGPSMWQSRAPWFARILSPNAIRIDGNHRATMDAEIHYASRAGLRYWAYVWYPGGDPMMNAWALHQSSSLRDEMNWCFLFQLSNMGGASGFGATSSAYANYCSQHNYQTVLGSRPLIYLFVDDPRSIQARWGGRWSNVKGALNTFRAACTGRGLPNPYIVLMYNNAKRSGALQAAAYASQAGCDAISIYGNAHAGTYSALAAATQNLWEAQAATRMPIIPTAVMGWDPRPRSQHPPAWAKAATNPERGPFGYTTPGTVMERATHIRAAISYIQNNASACAAKTLLIYAWNECDEGGGMLIPTLGDPPPSSLLAAIEPILS